MTIVTSLSWVPQGVAATQPILNDITSSELTELKQMVDGASVDIDNSDDSDDQSSSNPGGMFYSANTQDPYITEQVSDEDEIQNLHIPSSAYLLLAGRVNLPEREGFLEQWIVEPSSEDSYATIDMHHDRVLRSAPICTQWIGHGEGNHPCHVAAVGFMEPGIELWNMNEVDALEPIAVLGPKKHLSISRKRIMKKKGIVSEKEKEPGHKGAVLGLSWNTVRQNFLASSGDDGKVFVWDLDKTEAPVWKIPSAFKHKKAVQTVDWAPFSDSVIMTSSFDRTSKIFDLRQSGPPLSFKLEAEAESACWANIGQSLETSKFFIGCEDGSIQCFDPRDTSTRLYMIDAHKSSTHLNVHPRLPHLLVSGGSDKCLKAWNIGSEPKMLHKENVSSEVGEVFALQFNPFADENNIGLLAVGGSKDDLEIFDVASWKNVL
ncbi:hypothetical protein P9112_008182 [Eukaryota sp. TZLM1-RC]